MTTNKVTPPAPAPPPQQKHDVDLRILCEKLRKEAVLTPPGVIDKLCAGEPLPEVCKEAAFVDELKEFAALLNRSHLLTFKKCRCKV
jgi:hypothetical protein